MPKYLIALDTETGGLFAGKHPLLEIACIVADARTGEYLDRYHTLIGYEELPQSTAFALRMNRYLERVHDPDSKVTVKPAKVVASEFFTWYNRMTQVEYPDHVLLGHNPNFDIDFVAAFMREYLGVDGWTSLISRDKTRDTRELIKFMMDAGYLPKLWSPKFEVVVKYLAETEKMPGKVRAQVDGQVHDALWDTSYTIELYRWGVNVIKQGCFSDVQA